MDSKIGTDFARHPVVVAGGDLERNSERVKLGERKRSARFRRIVETQESCKRKIVLITGSDIDDAWYCARRNRYDSLTRTEPRIDER